MRRALRLVLAVVVVAGAFLVCAGIPAATLYVVAHLGWPLAPSLLVGAAGIAAMMLVVVALGHVERRRVALGDPLPDGLEGGGVLLEASFVVALVVSVLVLVVLLVFGSPGGGSLGPFPD